MRTNCTCESRAETARRVTITTMSSDVGSGDSRDGAGHEIAGGIDPGDSIDPRDVVGTPWHQTVPSDPAPRYGAPTKVMAVAVVLFVVAALPWMLLRPQVPAGASAAAARLADVVESAVPIPASGGWRAGTAGPLVRAAVEHDAPEPRTGFGPVVEPGVRYVDIEVTDDAATLDVAFVVASDGEWYCVGVRRTLDGNTSAVVSPDDPSLHGTCDAAATARHHTRR